MLRFAPPRVLVAVLTVLALAVPSQPAAKPAGKVIAVPKFKTPEHVLAPARPVGSPTLSYSVAGKLVMRGCFTSTFTDGRKVKCSGAVRNTCVSGREIEVYAPYSQAPRTSVAAGPDGAFSAPVATEDDYQEVLLSVDPVRKQKQGRRIICFAGSLWIDISEARP